MTAAPPPTDRHPASLGTDPAPRVSLVVLTHDRPRSLRRCLESLLAQRCAVPCEIVVADDGSGPATAAVIAGFAGAGAPVVHLRQPHRGIAAARNLGLGAARGELVSFLADDYVLDPDHVAAAVGFLDARPDAVVVRFRIEPLGRHLGGRVSHLYYDASIRRRLLREAVPPAASRRELWRAAREQLAAPERPLATRALEAAGAAMFRAPVLRQLGGFDPGFARGEDTELTARLHALGHVVHLLPAPRVAHDYRRLPVDTLRKCWLTGRNLPRAVARAVHGPPATAPSGKAQVLGAELLRLARRRELALLVAALPWLLAFELAVRAGLRLGRRERARARAANAGAAPPGDGASAGEASGRAA